MCSMKTCWSDAVNHIIKNNIWNQHLHLQLLMKKKNTKLKKYGSIGKKAEECNTWCIRKIMGMNMINRSWNWGCFMQGRWLKIISQGIQVKTYKEGGVKSHFDSSNHHLSFQHKYLHKPPTTTMQPLPLPQTLTSLESWTTWKKYKQWRKNKITRQSYIIRH